MADSTSSTVADLVASCMLDSHVPALCDETSQELRLLDELCRAKATRMERAASGLHSYDGSVAAAPARAIELFAATGSLVGDFDWTTFRGETRVGSNDVELTIVRGTRLLAGEPTSDNWLMEFGNGNDNEVRRASGRAWQPIPIGDVGLLTTTVLAVRRTDFPN